MLVVLNRDYEVPIVIVLLESPVRCEMERKESGEANGIFNTVAVATKWTDK
jgi:hypothetical protein